MSHEEEDNQYFESENLHHLPADHPLMARFQGALKQSLEADHEKTHLQLREKEAKLKKADREKENTAVRLYEVQQNLATLHLNLEQTHENYNLIQKLRTEAEQKVTIFGEQYNVRKGQMDQLNKNIFKAMDELSKMTRTLKQIEEYNEKIRGDKEKSRRITHVAEENIAHQEKLKKHQDLLIDHLSEQKKKVNEQLAIVDAQLLAQKDETKAAKDILREAFSEMETIIASKKNLLDRWQKSLLEMGRRDKALQVAREALKVQYEQSVQINSELAGVKNEIKKEAAIAENLTHNLNRLKLDEKYLDEEKQKYDHNYQKIAANIKVLQQSLQVTEAAAQASDRDNKKIQDQMSFIEENIMKIHTQATKLYDQVINRISEHKTLEKRTGIVLKQSQIIHREMEDKEIEKETVENEIARVSIDTLNTTNQIDTLRKKKREVSEERKQKEIIIAEYDLQIREGHDINEKKQAEVGKLNKVHDIIINSSNEVNAGTLDAQVKHLTNQIRDKGENIQLLERSWIKKQTILVKNQCKFAELTEKASELKTKKVIHEQKRMRLDTIYKNNQKEIQEIKISLKNLQTEMNRLNEGKSKNEASELKLVNETFNIQSDMVEKLKELESYNVNLELSIDQLKEEKAELLQNIVEAEKQLLLWERKMQLEKEIQAALDPEIGQVEIKLLKKDIHMMELRLDEIRRKQEQTIHDMEREVSKTDIIRLKYTTPDEDEPQKKKVGKENKTHIQKQIQNLKGSLKQSAQNNAMYDKKLGSLRAQLTEKGTMIKDLETGCRNLESELSETLALRSQAQIDKIVGIFEVSKLQKRAQAIHSLANNDFRLAGPENQLRQGYEKQREMNTQMIFALRELAEVAPQCAPVLQSLVSIGSD